MNGRVGTFVRVLKRAGFDRIVVTQQAPCVSSSGYASFVPLELQLFYVYAVRTR